MEVIHVFEIIKETLIDDKTTRSASIVTPETPMNASKTKKKTTGKAAIKPRSANVDGDQQLLNDLSSIGKNGKNILPNPDLLQIGNRNLVLQTGFRLWFLVWVVT